MLRGISNAGPWLYRTGIAPPLVNSCKSPFSFLSFPMLRPEISPTSKRNSMRKWGFPMTMANRIRS